MGRSSEQRLGSDTADAQIGHGEFVKLNKPSMRGVARGSAANLAGAAIFGLTNLLVTILVTHRLEQSEAGVFFGVTSVFLIATSMGALGTNTGLVYFIARSCAAGKAHLVPRYFEIASRPVVTIGLIMAAVLFVFAPQVARLTNASHSEQAITYLRACAFLVPFAGLENVALSATRGLGTMRPNVMVEQIGRSLLQVGCLAVALIVPTRFGVGLAWALPYLPAAMLAYLWWGRLSRATSLPGETVPGDDQGLDPPPAGLRSAFWRFTAPRAVSGLAQQIMQRLDIVLVAALAGATEAAIYTAATRFLVVGQLGNRAISMAVQPRIAAALARKDHQGANYLYRISTSWLMLITWPLYLTFIIFGPTVLTVFGRGYDAGSAVLIILASSMLAATSTGMVDIVLTMAGRTSWNLMNVLTGLAVNIGVDIWLIPSHGILGAAIGWAAAIVTQNVLALSQVGLSLRLHPFGRITLVTIGLNLLSFALVPLTARMAMGTSWGSLICALLVGSACYVVGLWACRGTLELAALRQIRRSTTTTAART